MPLLMINSLNILSWNCRGAAHSDFIPCVKELVRNNKVDILIIMETHISGRRADRISRSLGFEKVFRMEAIGFFSGIWCFWHPSIIQIEVLVTHKQFIHCIVCDDKLQVWYLTAVYASPYGPGRECLWRELKRISEITSLPWMLVGDFNDYASPIEKRGGSFSMSRAALFRKNYNDCNLMNLRFKGPIFTYRKRTNGVFSTFVRLDRALCNNAWRTLFSKASVHHLPRTHSDHNPILLKLYGFIPPAHSRPFRFQDAWTLHKDFTHVVHGAWNLDHSFLHEALNNVKDAALKFNRDVFGNIFQRKKRVLARLKGIQSSLAYNQNPYLIALEDSLVSEYNDIVRQEELYWFQKSHVQWLQLGDKNTKFFHAMTISHPKRNRIERLRDSEGMWIADESDLQTEV